MNPVALYCVDTHALYWYLVGSNRLSAVARQIFADAAAGRAVLVVHYVVLAEISYLLVKHAQASLFTPLMLVLKSVSAFRIEPIELADIERLEQFSEISEMHDRLIAIAANRLGAKLVTRDSNIKTSPQLTCVW